MTTSSTAAVLALDPFALSQRLCRQPFCMMTYQVWTWTEKYAGDQKKRWANIRVLYTVILLNIIRLEIVATSLFYVEIVVQQHPSTM